MDNECPHVEAFLNSVEGQKFIEETNKILEDIEWQYSTHTSPMRNTRPSNSR